MTPVQPDTTRFVRALDKPLPLVERPFAELGHSAGIPEEELLDWVRSRMADGVIRRFGARVSHGSVGYVGNGMSVWEAAPDQVEKAVAFMSQLPEVSHCYLRRTAPGWNYNLYAMIHGKSREEVRRAVRRIADHTGIQRYEVLFSTKEFKKSVPQYFAGDPDGS